MLKADGLDDAVIGVTHDMATGTRRLVYSVDKCVEVLMKRDGMDRDGAREFWSLTPCVRTSLTISQCSSIARITRGLRTSVKTTKQRSRERKQERFERHFHSERRINFFVRCHAS